MKNTELKKLWQKYAKAASEEEQYAIMKEFMFNASFEDFLAWNHYLGEKANKIWIDNQKTGLSDEDKAWYKEQFAKFDKLEEQIKLGKAA